MSEIVPFVIPSNSCRTRTRRTWVRLLVAILVDLSMHWLVFQSREVVPGVIARPLDACDVEWFGRRGGIVVLVCPHTDLIKLWPLPFEQPWYEDSPYSLVTAMRE